MTTPDGIPTLMTRRLVLRPITEADASAIFAYAQNPTVAEFTMWAAHQSVDDSLRFIREYVAPHYEDGSVDPLGIELRAKPGVVVGTAGCFWVGKKEAHMELAYALAEPLWGQGIATEASAAVLDYVFEHLPVRRVQARCRKDNLASQAVIRKLGMKYEGAVSVGLLAHGITVDLLVHSVLRDEWRSRRNPV